MSAASLTPVLIHLPNSDLSVGVLPYGLHVTQIMLNAGGIKHDVAIGPFTVEEHAAKRGYLNPVIGRYANRLPVGEFVVQKDGESGIVRPIENDSPGVSIHGGPDGFDCREWTKVDLEMSLNFSTKEKERLKALGPDAIAIFGLRSPAGDQGFPGELYTEVLFAVLEPSKNNTLPTKVPIGAVVLVHRARLMFLKMKVACPVNLTQHWGFNLSASLLPHSADPIVNQHQLRIASLGTLETKDNFLATGYIIDTVKGGPWDHSLDKLIGDQAPHPQGYDEYYMFQNRQDKDQPIHVKVDAWEAGDLLEDIFKDTTKETPVELYSPESGVRAEFQTNQPGVQLCTAEWLDGSGTKKAIHGGSASGGGYKKRAAAFLEFHEPHAAWLHPWGAKGDTIISTQDMYHNYVKVMFSYKLQECEPPIIA